MQKLQEVCSQPRVKLVLFSAVIASGLFFAYRLIKRNSKSNSPTPSGASGSSEASSVKPTLFKVLTGQSEKRNSPLQRQNNQNQETDSTQTSIVKLSPEEIQKIRFFVVNNFSPILDEINSLKDSLISSAQVDVSELKKGPGVSKGLSKVQVQTIMKAASYSMVLFERAKTFERRNERRKKMNSEEYVKECLKPYTSEYLLEFEKKLSAILKEVGVAQEDYQEARKRTGLANPLDDAELEAARKLIRSKCMIPTKILNEEELLKALKLLIAVFFTYASKRELDQISFLFPVCCEDELYEALKLNGEEITASIYQYCKGKDERLYPHIKEYLRLFVKAV